MCPWPFWDGHEGPGPQVKRRTGWVHEEEGTIVSIERTTPADDRIVVGIDGSEQSQLALRWAAYLARVSGSTIEAVTAWQPITVAATAGGSGT